MTKTVYSRKVIEFRNKMAEAGVEYSMEKAAEVYQLATDLMDHASGLSQSDLWEALKTDYGDKLSDKDKQAAVEILQYARG